MYFMFEGFYLGGTFMLKGRSLLEPVDFSLEELDGIFDLADRIIADPQKYAHACDGKL